MDDWWKELAKNVAGLAKKKLMWKLWHELLAAEAKSLTEDLMVGDIVSVNDALGIVVADGVIASLQLKACQWLYSEAYNPYTRGLANIGECKLDTGAYSRVDGRDNQQKVVTIVKKENSVKPSAYGCPPSKHHIPAFDECSSLGEGWFLPAIEELYDMFMNPEVVVRWKEKAGFLIDVDLMKKDLLLWSSTENKHYSSDFMAAYSEALALHVYPKGNKCAYSMIKSKEAMVVAFYRIKT